MVDQGEPREHRIDRGVRSLERTAVGSAGLDPTGPGLDKLAIFRVHGIHRSEQLDILRCPKRIRIADSVDHALQLRRSASASAETKPKRRTGCCRVLLPVT